MTQTLSLRSLRSSRWFAAAAIVLSASLAAPLAGCSGKGSDSAASAPKAGSMPSGETWTGVYFHPVFGYLHLVENGTNIVGRWKRADESAWGELEGTVEGNIIRYKWVEHKIGLVGAASSSKGKGWFQYQAAKEEKGSAEIDGKFGLEDGPEDADWHSVKQQRMTPNLDSINGDTAGAPSAGGGWQ